MYKYTRQNPHSLSHSPLDSRRSSPTDTPMLLLSAYLSPNMSHSSSPIYLSSRDSTLTPQPTPNLVHAQVQALAEAS